MATLDIALSDISEGTPFQPEDWPGTTATQAAPFLARVIKHRMIEAAITAGKDVELAELH